MQWFTTSVASGWVGGWYSCSCIDFTEGSSPSGRVSCRLPQLRWQWIVVFSCVSLRSLHRRNHFQLGLYETHAVKHSFSRLNFTLTVFWRCKTIYCPINKYFSYFCDCRSQQSQDFIILFIFHRFVLSCCSSLKITFLAYQFFSKISCHAMQ